MYSQMGLEWRRGRQDVRSARLALRRKSYAHKYPVDIAFIGYNEQPLLMESAFNLKVVHGAV
jgi:hypothetical protein